MPLSSGCLGLRVQDAFKSLDPTETLKLPMSLLSQRKKKAQMHWKFTTA
jgi:hypothetical protein